MRKLAKRFVVFKGKSNSQARGVSHSWDRTWEKQVNLYAAPADVAQHQQRISEIEPMCILHSRSPGAPVRVLPRLDFKEDGQRQIFHYLVRELDLAGVITQHVPAQGYWSISVLRSPFSVLRSWNSIVAALTAKFLRRGRVYYVDGFYGENDEWIEKSEGFRK